MRKNALRTKKITFLALFASLALLLSYVEMLLPPIFTTVPGIKMGLPNIVILLILYRFGIKEAAIISFVRILLVTLTVSPRIDYLWYSLAGAVLSLAIMAILKKLDFLSTVGVSVAGAIMHNVGQMIVAVLLLQTSEIGYYMIVLSITGTIAGIFIGLCGALMHKRLEKIKI